MFQYVNQQFTSFDLDSLILEYQFSQKPQRLIKENPRKALGGQSTYSIKQRHNHPRSAEGPL